MGVAKPAPEGQGVITMLDSFFLTVNQWMTGTLFLAGAGCFVWGMISCAVQPLPPGVHPLDCGLCGRAGPAARFPAGRFLCHGLYPGAVYHHCRDRDPLRPSWPRMLGDVGNYWQILVGLILVWVALGMLGVEVCSLSGGRLYRMKVSGMSGAFVLGLAYGGPVRLLHLRIYCPPSWPLSRSRKKSPPAFCSLCFSASATACRLWWPAAVPAAVKKLLENNAWNGAGASGFEKSPVSRLPCWASILS